MLCIFNDAVTSNTSLLFYSLLNIDLFKADTILAIDVQIVLGCIVKIAEFINEFSWDINAIHLRQKTMKEFYCSCINHSALCPLLCPHLTNVSLMVYL